MADLEREILDKVGKYNLSELDIISYRQQKDESRPKTMDIKGITLTMSITEDIFSNCMNGSILVYDTQDVRSLLPLTGLERLSFKLNTPGLPALDFTETNGVPFHIYKVDTIRKDNTNDKGQFYKIFFCSPEMYYNQLTSVSRAYAGPIETGVKDIFRNKKYLNSKKKLFVEETATNAKYVIPSLKPFKAINYLSSQCTSGKYNNAGYLFFENSKGFHFRSLESLLAMGGSVARPTRWNFQTQVTQVKDTGKGDEVKDIEKRMQTVIQYEAGRQVDALENIKNGLYANRLVVHDAFNKTLTTHDFNYKEDFEKGYHTETTGDENDTIKGIIPEAKLNDTNTGLYEFADSKKMVVTETSGVHNDYEFTPTKDTLPKITSQRRVLRNMNMSMLVYGNTLLNCGDVINFTVPIMQPSEEVQPNPYTSGRYLILAIKHTIAVTTQDHTMVLKCMKDSVRTPLPSEEDALIVGKDNTDEVDIYKQDIVSL